MSAHSNKYKSEPHGFLKQECMKLIAGNFFPWTNDQNQNDPQDDHQQNILKKLCIKLNLKSQSIED